MASNGNSVDFLVNMKNLKSDALLVRFDKSFRPQQISWNIIYNFVRHRAIESHPDQEATFEQHLTWINVGLSANPPNKATQIEIITVYSYSTLVCSSFILLPD